MLVFQQVVQHQLSSPVWGSDYLIRFQLQRPHAGVEHEGRPLLLSSGLLEQLGDMRMTFLAGRHQGGVVLLVLGVYFNLGLE